MKILTKAEKTPNPCIMCNKFIKWGLLLDYAIETLGADVYATGHYANIENENGIFKLYPAADEHKDQLLFSLPSESKSAFQNCFSAVEVYKIRGSRDCGKIQSSY